MSDEEEDVGVVDVGERPKVLSEKQTMEFRFHDFANLPQKPTEAIVSDSILCHGFVWVLLLNPRGFREPADENCVNVSVFLARRHLESNVEARFRLRVDSAHHQSRELIQTFKNFRMAGFTSFATRADVLDNEKKFLVDGTLTIKVDIQIYSDRENKIPADRGVLVTRARRDSNISQVANDERNDSKGVASAGDIVRWNNIIQFAKNADAKMAKVQRDLERRTEKFAAALAERKEDLDGYIVQWMKTNDDIIGDWKRHTGELVACDEENVSWVAFDGDINFIEFLMTLTYGMWSRHIDELKRRGDELRRRRKDGIERNLCSICFVHLRSRRIACGHVFCESCAQRFTDANSCPQRCQEPNVFTPPRRVYDDLEIPFYTGEVERRLDALECNLCSICFQRPRSHRIACSHVFCETCAQRFTDENVCPRHCVEPNVFTPPRRVYEP